jgi:hypothetical protein
VERAGTADDPVAAPERRVVHHVHRTTGGRISLVCAGALDAPWSPRPVDAVLADLRSGSASYVVSWLDADRPVVAVPGRDGTEPLHSSSPAGGGNALDGLPPCPVHTEGPRGRRRRDLDDDGVLAARRARHPSVWPPRLLPPA